ncbi:MAG: type II toxin-antitoxin system VapC family toxin [Spirochaetaceae bacterium]
MRILLDTHIFLWWLDNSTSLDSLRKGEISNPHNEVFLSAAVIWEIAVKNREGNLSIPDNWYTISKEEDFTPIPITAEHTYHAGLLPDIHTDPFDRLLIAQAQVEGLILMTDDEFIEKYNIQLF